MNGPNILWYCTDQQRFDTIRALGNAYINTPHLDALVRRGVSFTQAYTQCPVCTASRASFLTGRYPASHHVYRNGTDYFPSHELLVTKILAENGYECGLIGKLHLSRAQDRVEIRPDDGYSSYFWSHHPQPDWPTNHDYADWLEKEKGTSAEELFGPSASRHYGAGVPEEYHQTTWCTERAIQFLSKKRKSPWLLSVNTFDPHPPFDPPEEYLSRYDSSRLPPPLFRHTDVHQQEQFRDVDVQTVELMNHLQAETRTETAHVTRMSSDTAAQPPRRYSGQEVKACYYAMIELIDHQFGRIVEFLQQTNQLENTIIIFMSDHGELLGDHGLIYKGCRFFESLVHVPLVVSWPARYCQNVRKKALVELIDIAPTLLEAAGLSVDESMQGRSLDAVLADAKTDVHKACVVSEYYDALNLPNKSHGSMYFDGRYKTAVYHGTGMGEIYDLASDPGEFDNLWNNPDYSGLKADLIQRHFDAMMNTIYPGIKRTANY